MNRRLAVFIDGKTFALGLRRASPAARVSFARLAAWLVERTGATARSGLAYYTGVEAHGSARLLRFLDWLDTQPGMHSRSFPRVNRSAACTACRGTTHFTQEKGVDTSIAVDLVGGALRREYDVAVLIGGDRDHLPAVQVVRGMGVPVYVASWGGYGMSAALREAASRHFDLMEGLVFFGATVSRLIPQGEQRPVRTGAPREPASPALTCPG